MMSGRLQLLAAAAAAAAVAAYAAGSRVASARCAGERALAVEALSGACLDWCARSLVAVVRPLADGYAYPPEEARRFIDGVEAVRTGAAPAGGAADDTGEPGEQHERGQ